MTIQKFKKGRSITPDTALPFAPAFFRYILPPALVVALSSALLTHFALIARQGTVTISEPSLPVLVGEILVFAAIFGFGCWAFIQASLQLAQIAHRTK